MISTRLQKELRLTSAFSWDKTARPSGPWRFQLGWLEPHWIL